jgi:cysteine synthase
MHSPAVAILPEGMSQERFDWLKSINAEIVKTPDSDSSIKGVLDECNKLVKEGEGKIFVLDQFSDFSNPIWHYWCTGKALEKIFNHLVKPGQRLAGMHLCEGSGGTLCGSSYYIRQKFPLVKIAAGEAIQCPTLMTNGFGNHRIEGIGDAFVPWILNMKNIDVIVGIDDEDVMKIVNLFNQPAGIAYLREKGVKDEIIEKLQLMGISSVANLVGCIKEAKMFEFNEKDVIVSVCTDSMKLYQSRLKQRKTEFTRDDAIEAYSKCLIGQGTDYCKELTYIDKKRCHSLKYFTWIEQQGKKTSELNDQWYEDEYWDNRLSEKEVDMYDSWIQEFNKKTGFSEKYCK